MALLEVDELSVEIPQEGATSSVVDRVSFAIEPGESIGLVGDPILANRRRG